MLAYHNDQTIKTDILAQLQKHHDADEFVKGQYWEGGKGCAVGCTIYSSNHREYETRFGIPVALAKLEDTLFERLPNANAKEWPLRFMGAIRPGADLTNVARDWLVWLLTDKDDGVIRFAQTDGQRAVIAEVADALMQSSKIFDWAALRDRAWKEYRSAYAADAAAYADAAYAAAYAADAAAYAAAYADDAADAAAAYAADAAAYADAAYAAAYAADAAAYAAAYADDAADAAAAYAAYAAYAAAARRRASRGGSAPALSAAASAEQPVTLSPEEARTAAIVRQSEKLLELLAAA